MFLSLARWFQEQDGASSQQDLEASAARVFALHPAVLGRALEEAYSATGELPSGGTLPSPALPPGVIEKSPSGLDQELTNVTDDIYPLGGGGQPFVSHHLIYAYLIEQTRAFEVFHRVLFEYLHGERLDTPSEETQRWLRATEDLLYRDAPSFQINAVTSWVRPDIRASRRNAYWRLFGMDLDHGASNGGEYPYERAAASNSGFVPTFEEFCRQVWIGIENVSNTSGPNPTDDGAIATLGQELFEMLRDRRQSGNLAREEFVFVAMMSWLHLTVLFDSPVVRDLEAEASNPKERLNRIGGKVGIPAHPMSKEYFELAEPLSRILIAIEAGLFNSAQNAPVLYAPGAIHDDMETVITRWSIGTGRDLKARKVSVSPPAPGGMPPNGQPVPAAAEATPAYSTSP
jgi:hypothetical protein